MASRACYALAQALVAARSAVTQALLAPELASIVRLGGMQAVAWFQMRTVIAAVLGLLLLAAAALLVAGRDGPGIALARLGLLLNIAVVDLMVFYLDQFRAILPAIIEFAVLLLVLHYRRRYLQSARADER